MNIVNAIELKFNAITNYTSVWNLDCWELKIFVRCQNKGMALMAPSDGAYNYIDSYGHLLVNSGFIFTYLVEALFEEDSIQSQTQEEITESLGIIQQAVSVRLRAMKMIQK